MRNACNRGLFDADTGCKKVDGQRPVQWHGLARTSSGNSSGSSSGSSSGNSEYAYSTESQKSSSDSNSGRSGLHTSISCSSVSSWSSCSSSSSDTITSVAAGSSRSWGSKLWSSARSFGSLLSGSNADTLANTGNASPVSSNQQPTGMHVHAAAAPATEGAAQKFGQQFSFQQQQQQQQQQGEGREQLFAQPYQCQPQIVAWQGKLPAATAEATAMHAQQPPLQATQVCPQPQHLLHSQQVYHHMQHTTVQQLHLQQLHLVPVLLPAQQGATTAAAAAAGSTGCYVPALQPQYGPCLIQTLDPRLSCGQLYQQQPAPGLSTCLCPTFHGLHINPEPQHPAVGCARVNNVPGKSIWEQAWLSVAAVMQQQREQQLQRQQQQLVSTAPPAAPGFADFAGQQWSSVAHALAALLMYMLLRMVVAMVAVHKRLAAAAAGITATKDACTGFVQQQQQLFMTAAAGVAAAADVEQLRQLLGRPDSSACNAVPVEACTEFISAAEDSSSFGAHAELDRCSRCSSPQQQQPPGSITSSVISQAQVSGREQQLSADATAAAAGIASGCTSSSRRLVVVLGLWVGVLLWVGRWLLLHAPVATSQAVATTYQQSLSAAEEAALVAVEYVVCVIYGLTCVVLHQVRALTARLLHVVCAQGYVLAHTACCCGLWFIGFLMSDSIQQRSVVIKATVQMVQAAAAVIAKVGQQGLAAAEVVAAAVTAKLLRDASPVTQTAVWGLAGMLKRNVVESCHLCWQLLLQLSQVYIMHQQQQQQQ